MKGYVKITRRKDFYEVGPELRDYLRETRRDFDGPAIYHDLLTFSDCFPLLDRRGKSTVWQTLHYDRYLWNDLRPQLLAIYMALRSGRDPEIESHLQIDRVDFCEYGNSRPFRIRVINQFNDNVDHFYVKIADASRIHGLELEHILSPNRIHYLVNGATLVEEHIAGIPGDMFLAEYLPTHDVNLIRLTKEFVKFDERCFVRLLGDMRTCNYVVDITQDFEDEQYRVRAIDFDQQSYDGRLAVYRPRHFEDNAPISAMVEAHLNLPTRRQYRFEERSLIAKRIPIARRRLDHLLDVMTAESAAPESHIRMLREELNRLYRLSDFSKCLTTGELVRQHLNHVMAEIGEDA